MAIEALGRVFNIIPIADGVAIRLRAGESVTFFTSGADTFTITTGATSAAADDPGDIIDHAYIVSGATNGTVAWAEQAVTPAAAAVAFAGASTGAIHFSAEMMPAGSKYVKCTKSVAGLVYAVVHDLLVQRKPDNLEVLSA